MTDERALLEGVLADPADDAPRLIFADAAQEAGKDELAAFVRWQVGNRRSFIPVSWDDLCGTSSPSFEEELPSELVNWFFGFANEVVYKGASTNQILTPPYWRWTWHRGFVARVEMPADDALLRLGPLLANWPITTVVLTRPLSWENRDVLDKRKGSSRSWKLWKLERPTFLRHDLNMIHPRVRFRERSRPTGFDITTMQWEEMGAAPRHYQVFDLPR